MPPGRPSQGLLARRAADRRCGPAGRSEHHRPAHDSRASGAHHPWPPGGAGAPGTV